MKIAEPARGPFRVQIHSRPSAAPPVPQVSPSVPLNATSLDTGRSTHTPAVPPEDRQGGSKRGRWTKAEHELFLQALNRYGHDWTKIQAFVGTRTSTQARSHAQKYFARKNKTAGMTRTSKEEQTHSTGPFVSPVCKARSALPPAGSVQRLLFPPDGSEPSRKFKLRSTSTGANPMGLIQQPQQFQREIPHIAEEMGRELEEECHDGRDIIAVPIIEIRNLEFPPDSRNDCELPKFSESEADIDVFLK